MRTGSVGVERRLADIGFLGGDSLSANVRAFERHYGLPETGSPEAIEATVTDFHDRGTLPIVVVSPLGVAGPPLPTPPAPPPPTLGHPKHGDGAPPGRGLARCDHLVRQIRVLDLEQEPVPATRCVVQVGGLRSTTTTDGRGVAFATTPRTATQCALEWEANGTTLQRIGVRLHGQEAVDIHERLGNLGFLQGATAARVEGYQRELGRKLTGLIDDVAAEVAAWHDGGAKPPEGPQPALADELSAGGAATQASAFVPTSAGGAAASFAILPIPLQITTASPAIRCVVFRDSAGTVAPHDRVFDRPNDIWRLDVYRGMHTGVTFFNSGGVGVRSNNPGNAVPNDSALFIDDSPGDPKRHVFFYARFPPDLKDGTKDTFKNQTTLFLTPKKRTVLQVRVKPLNAQKTAVVKLFGKTMALNSRGLPAYNMDHNEKISDNASQAGHVEPSDIIQMVLKHAPLRHLVINAHAGMDNIRQEGFIRLGHDIKHFGAKVIGFNIGFHRGNLDLWDALAGKVEFIWVQACFCGADDEFMGTIAHKTKAWVSGAAMQTDFKPKIVTKGKLELLHAFFPKYWSPDTPTVDAVHRDEFHQQGRRKADPNLDTAMNFNLVKVT